jgi:hypothetical protein
VAAAPPRARAATRARIARARRAAHMHPLHLLARHPKVSESQNSGRDISKPFVQPIKTRESGARPVLVYSSIVPFYGCNASHVAGAARSSLEVARWLPERRVCVHD